MKTSTTESKRMTIQAVLSSSATEAGLRLVRKISTRNFLIGAHDTLMREWRTDKWPGSELFFAHHLDL